MSGRIEGAQSRDGWMQSANLAIRRCGRDHGGNVAMLFGLMAMVMFVIMGAAIDYGRWLHARDQTKSAIDAAVLAAGRALQVNPDDVDGALAIADKYYAENVKNRASVLSDTISFESVDNNTAITAQGAAFMATTLLNLIGIDQLPLLDEAGADFSKAVIAVGGSAGINLEISLMLDTSGSMNSNNKFEDMKEAATDLVNIVVWADQSEFTSRVAIAPFSADMRVPDSILDTVRGSDLPSEISRSFSCGWKGSSTCSATYKLSPCIAERVGADKYTDAAPAAGARMLGVYSASGSCSQDEENAMAPLSSDKQAIIDKIDDLTIGGATAGHLGTAWAWYPLAPTWNSVWPSSAAADYGTENTRKIAILMTDGEYNTQYDENGIKTSTGGAGPAANGNSNVQAKALCDAMKAKGITVYTIGFDLGGNETAIETLTYCATDPGKFYNAEDGEELKQSFRDIALKLSALYLSR